VTSSLTGIDLTRDPQPADNLILWLPVFLAFGIGVYFLLPYEPSFMVVWSGFGVAAGVTAVTFGWRDYLAWRWAVSFALAFTLGVGLVQLDAHTMQVPLLEKPVWNGVVTGTIDSFERGGTGWRVMLNEATINEGETHYSLRLSVRGKDFTPAIGGTLKAQANLMAPSPPLVPGGFDFRRYAFFQQMSGYGYASKVLQYTPPPNAEKSDSALENYRDWLTERVYSVLQQPEAGIVVSLLNGKRGGIAKTTNTTLQRSGLYHVISISGLHVSLFAMIIFFTVRLLLASSMTLALRLPIKKIAAFCALIGIVFYLLIVGNSPPTLRSVIMTGATLVAIMLDREPIQMRIVALSALGIILLQPDSVIDIGFQMSFVAVIGLVGFYQQTREFWARSFWKGNFLIKLVHIVIGTIVTSLVATIVTAPLVLLYFQQIPLLSMLANVLAAPPITFLIMPGTFMTYLFASLPVLGDFSIHVMGWGVKLMLDVGEYVAQMPASVWKTAPLPLVCAPLILLGFFILISVKNRWKYAGIVPVLIGIGIAPFFSQPDLYLTQNRLILYPQPDGPVLYADGKVQNFDKNILLQWTTRKEIQPFDCEDEICDLKIKGHNVRLVRSIPALAHACEGQPELIVTRFYLDQECPDTLVLDRHDLDEKGGQAVWLGKAIHVKAAFSGTARRPWQ